MKQQATVSVASAIGDWLSAESRSFTAMCGERITRAEVVMTGVGTAALILSVVLAVKLANWLAGGVA